MDTIDTIEQGDPSWALEGVRGVLPLLLGVVPFALIAGATASAAEVPLGAWLFMNLTVFAGAAQLAMVELWSHAAPAAVIVITAVVVNLRFLLYSRALAGHLAEARGRGLLSYLLTDQAFAVSMARMASAPDAMTPSMRRALYLGAALPLWITWQVFSAIGHLYGARLPSSWSLDFAVPLTFVAMLVPLLRGSHAASWAAGVGGLMALAGSGMPLHLGLLCGALLGITAGVLCGDAATAPRARKEAS